MDVLTYEDLKDWKYRVLETYDRQTNIKPAKLIKTLFSSLDTDGLLTIEKGFCTDGPSGAFDTENTMGASVPHDAGCNWRLMGLLTDKEIRQFDDLFEEILEEEVANGDMREFRKNYMVYAVRANTKIRYGV